MHDLLKREQIYNLRVHYKSLLVICRQKMVRLVLETIYINNKMAFHYVIREWNNSIQFGYSKEYNSIFSIRI